MNIGPLEIDIPTGAGISGGGGLGLIGGGIALAGDIYSANQAKKQAEINRQFQERLSSTAHQREVADLRAAGLNPILSGTGGSGSSTPSGAVAQLPHGIGERSVSSAIAARRAKAELELIQQQGSKTAQEAELTSALFNKAVEDTRASHWNANSAMANYKLIESQVPGRKVEEEIDSSFYGRALRYLGRMNPFGSTAAGVLRAVKP